MVSFGSKRAVLLMLALAAATSIAGAAYARSTGTGQSAVVAGSLATALAPGEVVIENPDRQVLLRPEEQPEDQVLVLTSESSDAGIREAAERQFDPGAGPLVVRWADSPEGLAAMAASGSTLAVVVDGPSLDALDAEWLKAKVIDEHVVLVGLNLRLGQLLDKLRPESLRWGLGSPEADGGRDPAKYYYSSIVIGILCGSTLNGAYGPEAESSELQREIPRLAVCAQPMPQKGG